MLLLHDDALDTAVFEVLRALFVIDDTIAGLQHAIEGRSLPGVLDGTNGGLADLTDSPVRTQNRLAGRASWSGEVRHAGFPRADYTWCSSASVEDPAARTIVKVTRVSCLRLTPSRA